MIKTTYDLFLECHGTKIPKDYFIIPDNINIISFSTEYEAGKAIYTAIFKSMVDKFGNKDFVDKFKYVLYIFGSSLIHMSESELIEECDLRGIKLDDKMAFCILAAIKGAGFSGTKQRIMLHMPGDILNNYRLAASRFLVNDKYLSEVVKEVVFINTTSKKVALGEVSLDEFGIWNGRSDRNYYNHDKFINFSRLGLSDITNGNKFIIFNEPENFEDMIYSKKTNLKDIIDILKEQPYTYTLFINHCKFEYSRKRSQPQRQKKQIHTLGLLQGIGI
jgi:hypothetical protein